MEDHLVESKTTPQLPLKIIIIGLVAGAAFNFFSYRLTRAIGVDFYHFWAVDVVLKLDHQAGSPYQKHAARYAHILKKYAQLSQDEALKLVNRYRRNPEFTASPLLYSLFSFFPGNYSTAFLLFQIILILLFISSLFWLQNLYHPINFVFICFASMLFLHFTPFAHDLLAGNINSLQFFCLTMAIVLASNQQKLKQTARVAALTGVLVFSALLKPNLAIIVFALLAYSWKIGGRRFFLKSIVFSLLWTFLFIGLGCFYFHDLGIWWKWLAFLRDQDTLIRPVRYANYASPIVLHHFTGLGIRNSTIFILLIFLVPTVLVLGKKISHWQCVLKSIIGNLHLVSAIAITFTAAIAPLMWSHYYLILIIPCLWIVNRQDNRYLNVLGAMALLLCSGAFDQYFKIIGWEKIFIPIANSCSWLPIWFATLLDIRKISKENRQKLIN